MKKAFFAYILYLVPSLCFSQTITPNALVSAAGEFTDNNTGVQISWTLGDFQTETFAKDELVLTQGFLQSNLKVTNLVEFEKFSNIELKVFPNPVIDLLTIQIKSENKQEVLWELINQNGSIIESSKQHEVNQKYQINFTSFESGIYFIRAYLKDGTFIKIFKVVYLN